VKKPANLKALTLSMLTLFGVFGAAQESAAQTASTMVVHFRWPNGRLVQRTCRGTQISAVGAVRDACNRAIPNACVHVFKRSTLGQRDLGYLISDATGRVTLPMTVPTNPNDDWVYIWMEVVGTSVQASNRIPIGCPNQ
jgi:hypothetical protein